MDASGFRLFTTVLHEDPEVKTLKMLGFQVFIDYHHIDYIGYYVYGTDTFKVNVFFHYQL